MKEKQSIYVMSLLSIPLKIAGCESPVGITPSFSGVDPQAWPAQICPAVGENAQINTKLLNPQQLTTLEQLHRDNITVFDANFNKLQDCSLDNIRFISC